MNLKFLFKILSFSVVTSFVYASERNDCNEIRDYLEKKSLNYTSTIEECGITEEGQVTELKVKMKIYKKRMLIRFYPMILLKNLNIL